MSLHELLTSDLPVLMGTLNCTPDSFSDGGDFLATSAALHRGREMITEGAGIIDIGGESSAPGRARVEASVELERIEGVVRELATEVVVSVDTYKARVADVCLSHGAHIINDVSGLRAEPELADVVQAHDAAIILMYSKQSAGAPHVDSGQKEYDDIIKSIGDFLDERITFALSRGLPQRNICIDPGMGGFLSPNPKYSWEVLRRLPELQLRFPEFPIVIGTSRKGFLGGALEQRDPASQLSGLLAFENGAKILRTHNVGMAKVFNEVWENCRKAD